MVWPMIAAAAISAAGSAYSANAASDAQQGAAKKNKQLQQQQYYNSLAMLEPTRNVGYQALSDLAALYGYSTPGYQPLGQLMAGGGGGMAGPYTVAGTNKYGGEFAKMPNPAGPLGLEDPITGFLRGDPQKRYGGTINPETGTVDVQGGGPRRDELATQYLRTGEWGGKGKGKHFQNLLTTIDRMRAGGYSFDPTTGQGAFAGAIPPTQGSANTQQTMLDKFRTMPGYQFGMQEGQNALERSAAARTGVLNGNTLRNTMKWGQDYAGTKFGEEYNRLASMAGLGQTATNQAIGVGGNYVTGAGIANTQQGDARASGVVNAYNGVMNTANQAYQNYLRQQYMQYLNGQGSGLGGDSFQFPFDTNPPNYQVGG